jgi:hypothetical protein
MFKYQEYEEAGCFNEEDAEILYDMGVTPEQASRTTDKGVGHYNASIGYKFANGDLSYDDVKEILETT